MTWTDVSRPSASRLACLDKDGTLLVNEPYNVDPARMIPAPDADAALRLLAAAGFRLAVVTNQPGVGLGRFPAQALLEVRGWLEEYCERVGVRLDGFYACPHVDGCACRKPRPGLVAAALAAVGADPGESWVIGDILDDVEAGNRAGCRTALVDVGNETEWVRGPHRAPTLVASSLLDAARSIVGAAS
jgi:D-glycero-D-manno-heptose 1,7-bisphosphate phosphatase